MNPDNYINNTRENQEFIDAYLTSNLDAQSLAEFKLSMDLYPEFKNKVTAQKDLMQAVEEYNLKKALDNYHTEIEDTPHKKRWTKEKIALASSLFILICVCIWALITRGNSSDKVFEAHFKTAPSITSSDGNSSNFEFFHGMTNYKRKEYDEAISKWEHLYAAKPANDTLIYYLGVANLAVGKIRQASNYLEKATVNPNSVYFEKSKYYLALSLLKEHKIENAKAVLKNSKSQENILLLSDLEKL